MLKPKAEIPSRVTDIPLAEMEIPYRLFNALNREGVQTLGEIDNMRDADLYRIPRIGRGSLPEIRKAVNAEREAWHQPWRKYPEWRKRNGLTAAPSTAK
jgi:DNA-directed RNA polymerase alpha subunit